MRAKTIEITYPLSPMQQGMLLHSLYAGNSGVYIQQLIGVLREDLRVPVFEQAWAQVALRHAVLRTSFHFEVSDKPFQQVWNEVSIPLETHDWRSLTTAEREQRLNDYLQADRMRGFDLETAPLLRLALFREGEASYRLLWTSHHALLDGRSRLLLLTELFSIYDALCLDETPRLASPRPYRDYIDWLGQCDFNQSETFWRRSLVGFTAATLLVPEWARHTRIGEAGHGRQSIRLSKATTASLYALVRQHELTVNTVFMGAWALLLSRYDYGSDDVVFGAVRACRRSAALEGCESVVGVFINTLPIRARVHSDTLLLPWLKELRAQWIAQRDYEHTPLASVQRWSDVSAGQPLFETIVVFENHTLNSSLHTQGAAWARREFRVLGITDCPLTVNAYADQELLVELTYERRRFDDTGIARMLGHLQTLLEAMAGGLTGRLADVPMLTGAEREQLLVTWNATQTSYPDNLCIHQLFETQANKTPEAIALVCDQQELSYKELNTRANQLAHYLKKRGVGPEALVAIYIERSIEMIVGVLGVLKAGGAYLTLDPSDPLQRFAAMVEDAQPLVLLTRQRRLGDLPNHNAKLICLDRDWPDIAKEAENNPASAAIPVNLAYVIYTSGSTGKPKGVMIAHRSLMNFVHAAAVEYGLKPGDKVLQFASFSFDASVEEIYPCLVRGATLVLRNDAMLTSAAVFLQTCRDWGLTLLSLPTAYWHEIIAIGAEQNLVFPASLRLIVIGGERALAERFANWRKCAHSGLRLLNTYGPSEATVNATLCDLTSADVTRPIPIGHPIANTQVYLLDPYLNPVPIGVAGELHIGGDGLARGYLNRPELTAEKFISNPFSSDKDARLYKTGDLARYLPDGNIEFLGRIDHQVKIRGFRIELGEIEAVFRQHPAIREIAVIAWEDTPGDKQLIAYLVAKDAVPAFTELRSFIQSKLPGYMLPALFITLKALPLTSSGKLDRKALPAPDHSRPEHEKTYIAPRTPGEQTLAEIWSDVLKLDNISIHDNFFELGGHSLQALRLASRISAAWCQDISVRFIILHPSIARLAEALMEFTAHAQAAVERPGLVGNIQTPAMHKAPWLTSPFLTIERRPLLSLFAAGKLPAVDAAALGYIPAGILAQTGLSHEELMRDWYGNLPACTDILETRIGRIAVIRLPYLDSELYNDQQVLVRTIVEALEVAACIGARSVSLTGLIPSATEYGQAITIAVSHRSGLPSVTTGHAATAATVVLAIKRILREGQRDLTQERVGCLGLGSIGLTSLRLMLQCLPHPVEISLCDVYSKSVALQRIQRQLVGELGFRGRIRILESGAEVPTEFYDATLIIGATNVPDILNSERLTPGTMIVDDSAPHCFAVDSAIERFHKQEDILFTSGGVLSSPAPISLTRYLPQPEEQAINAGYKAAFLNYHADRITGCVLSSLLCARFDTVKPVTGLADDDACLRHYELLNELGFEAADLHCKDYTLPEQSIRNFARVFGAAHHNADNRSRSIGNRIDQ